VQVSTFGCIMSTPQFSYLGKSTTTIRLQPTREADAVAAANKRKSFPPCKSPEDVERAARQAAGGFVVSEDVVLAHSGLQFGQYRGQSFLWVLENAAGYAVGLVDSVEGEPSQSKVTPLGVNKSKFCLYAMRFPEVRDALEMRRLTTAAEARYVATGDEGEHLVGFGQYARQSWKSVFEASDKERRSFVDFVINKKDVADGSKMRRFQEYCTRRRQEAQQLTTDSGEETVSDTDLLAAVEDMETDKDLLAVMLEIEAAEREGMPF